VSKMMTRPGERAPKLGWFKVIGLVRLRLLRGRSSPASGRSAAGGPEVRFKRSNED
jgi:hypothetical protein